MKKVLYVLLAILLLPILLFAGIGVALYMPAVQQWAVEKAADIASEQTGWQVSVGEVRLRFPLNLALHDVTAIAPRSAADSVGPSHGDVATDTVAQVGRLVADVALRPLMDNRVELRGMELNNARVNTLDLIADLHIEGLVGRLFVASRGVELQQELARVNGAAIEDTHLLIQMADTAAKDTTESNLGWRILADQLNIRRSSIELHMPGDTMRIAAAMKTLSASDAEIDLACADYQLGNARLEGATICATVSGLPDMRFDSIGARIEQMHMTAERLTASSMELTTAHSRLQVEADVDFSFADSISPGLMSAKANLNLDRCDLLRYAALMAQPVWLPEGQGEPLIDKSLVADVRRYLEDNISAEAWVKGNMQQMDGEARASMKSMATAIDLTARLIDRKLQIAADGRQQGGGRATLKAQTILPAGYMQGDIAAEMLQYTAEMDICSLHLGRYVPGAGLGRATLTGRVSGQGFDPMNRMTRIRARATLGSLAYDTLVVSDMDMALRMSHGRIEGQVDSRWPLLLGCIDIDGMATAKRIELTMAADLKQTDLQRLGLTSDPMVVSACTHLDISTDLNHTHTMAMQASDVVLRDSAETYQPDDVWLEAHTSRDTTWAKAESGDMRLSLEASGSYEKLMAQTMKVADLAMQQYRNRTIDQEALRREMPTARLYLSSGSDNTVADILRAQGVKFKDVYVNTTASPANGLNGQLQLHELQMAGYQIDTIHAALAHRMSRLIYGARVVNSQKNPQLVFAAHVGGHLLEHGGDINLRLYDSEGKLGLKLGTVAAMETDGLHMTLTPARPVLAYKEFALNADNYVLLDGRNRVEANVNLVSDTGTGIQLTSPEQDSTAMQDLTLSLTRLDLRDLTDIIPYMPRMAGIIEGDYHIVMDNGGNISVASDMAVHDMAYEDSPIGNLGSQFVYMQREDTTHVVQASFTLDNEEFGLLDGSYHGDKLDATLTLVRLPLSLVNGFVPDQVAGLDGYGQGKLTVSGPTDRLLFNGQLMLDSAYLVSHPYGLSMRFDDAPVQIVNSRLLMRNFGLYANGVDRKGRGTDVGDPLRINGYVDFLNIDKIYTDMTLRAENFQLINAKENPKSVAYGKVFVSAMAQLSGALNDLNMRGRLQVLGKTDLSYILRDSPLTTDTQLSDLVQFANFSDTTVVVNVQKPAVEGLSMNMQVDISQGTHVMAYLNESHSNYVDLTGGGTLTMAYNSSDGISMNGRYTLRGGQMKYSLPVIPLKTFTIKDGSYIEFRGDVMNPTLNITATETTKANVTGSNGVGRSVEFECGVEISKSLSDMGLAFTLDAPEDLQLSQELQAMSQEQRGKLAVSMLTTGMYLAEGQGNTEAFTMNDALTSFLNSEINNIAGTALRTVDVELGVDNTTDATGAQHTDYSFKFAKRFWNNRIKVQVGGLYSVGDEAHAANNTAASIFDNVSVEYRIDDSATKYVNLFYENNSYDWLEGYTQRYGAGFIWRRTLSRLRDIFRFSDKEKLPTFGNGQKTEQTTAVAPSDSLKDTDDHQTEQTTL
ncbi:MAG: translocation/assembly module TamB [Prevotella sp.]|nr:translocation/assembly module TamB [Prevotella sp.]